METIYGPYTRKDGRQIVILYENKVRKTVSYPKFIMEKYLRRKLEEWETVDHIDNNTKNNEISNLQILSRSDNAKKYAREFIKPSTRYTEYITLICKYCGKEFKRFKYRNDYDRNVRGKDGPFCSKECVGKVHH